METYDLKLLNKKERKREREKKKTLSYYNLNYTCTACKTNRQRANRSAIERVQRRTHTLRTFIHAFLFACIIKFQEQDFYF